MIRQGFRIHRIHRVWVRGFGVVGFRLQGFDFWMQGVGFGDLGLGTQVQRLGVYSMSLCGRMTLSPKPKVLASGMVSGIWL